MIIFFSRASRGRLQGRESFHVLVSTEPCCVNTPAADDRQQNRCRRPSGCVCLLYDLCFHMICSYVNRSYFRERIFSSSFFLKKKRKLKERKENPENDV